MDFCKLNYALYCSMTFSLALHAAAQAAPPISPQTDPSTVAAEEQIISAARARANACASGDAQTWATFVDANFRDIEGNATTTRKQIMDECREAARVIPGHKIERLASGFHFQFVGNIALVDYLYEFKEHFGDITLVDNIRQVDTFEKQQGKWMALLAVSAAVMPDPPVAKIDTATLDDFTGEYAWAGSQFVDTVTREGDKLYVQGSWEDSPTELLPESADTFFNRGGGVSPMARSTFVRDKTGRVVEERVYSPADGQGYHAKKIK
ncbi:MAG TPA: hypothetical protein VK930_01785 [Verrucomicrobiae bacterium]|jgi:hypothetical protein|nr:hypothetical protein [Verrucomicrobiae bacterium]